MISGKIEICIIYINGFLNVTFYDRKILKACISPCKLWIEGWSACPCRHNMQWKVCNLILKFPWKSNEVRNYTKINKNVKLHCKIHSMANSITYCIYHYIDNVMWQYDYLITNIVQRSITISYPNLYSLHMQNRLISEGYSMQCDTKNCKTNKEKYGQM